MAEWIILALGAPVFWSLSNIVDKVSVEKITINPSQFIFLLSQFYSVIFFIYFLTNQEWSFDFLAVTSGILLFFLYYLYAITLEKEDISAVILVHQAEPLFVLALVGLIYRAVPTPRELAGFLLILCGLLWFLGPAGQNKRQEKPFISARSIILLLLSALVGAGATIASDLALDHLSLMDLLGQSAFGYGLTGILMLIFSADYRIRAFTGGEAGMARKSVLIGLTGILDLAGYACFYAALARSPNAGLVAAVTSIHPIFVVALSALATLLVPSLLREDNSGSRLRRKAIACAIVVGGIILLD